MKPDADVYQGDKLVAHLYREPTGIALRFVPGVTVARNELARHLPLQDEAILTLDLHPFFLNLLPEGRRLALLLQAARSKDDSLDLLLKLGWDTIGDVAVLPAGVASTSHGPALSESSLAESSFWDLFYAGIEGADAAIPGVQEKISAATVAFGIRMASEPSGILKLNPNGFPQLLQNEEFFLRMARGCGLEVNKARIERDRLGEPGLLITRFDRLKVSGGLRKLHQEDGCQLLNQVPANKYAVSFNELATALESVCTAPKVEIARLLRIYIFSYLIGNGDLHAKNVSVIWGDTVQLSPAYDLLSTLPYDLEARMALRLDGRDDNFRARHFTEFANRFGIPDRAVRAMVSGLCERAKPWLARLPEIGFAERETRRLQRAIEKRIDHLSRP